MHHRKLQQLFRDNAAAPRQFKIENAADPDAATVFLYDAIGFFGVEAEDFVRELQAVTAPKILLRINSPGGDVFDARAMHTALRQHPATVEARIDGLAASAATFIALAGERVEIAPGGFFMIHKAWSLVIGDASELREWADVMDKIDQSIAADYVAKTGKSAEQVEEWMDAETWFNADEALAEGFVDGIMADGETADNRFNLSAYEHVPEALANPPEPRQTTPTRADMERRMTLYEKTQRAA